MESRQCWCVFIILVISEAMGQAPGDENSFCRMGQNARNFAPQVKILVDTFDYFAVLGQTGQWLDRDIDDDGNGWSPGGGACAESLQVCSFEQPNQNNWLFSQHIRYIDAVEVFFNASFSFNQCDSQSRCTNSYVTLYRFDSDEIVADSVRANPDNYVPLLGTVENSRLQASSGDKVLRLLRPAAATGFYLGIQDDGTCGFVNRLTVSYNVVLGRTQDLLTCPDVPVPQQNTDTTTQRQCTCSANASPVNSILDRICNVNSICNEDQDCACNPGFELSNGMCVACLEGEFKAGVSNSSCLPCPTNSESRGPANAVCSCIIPNIRNPDMPGDPCTSPPSSPRLLLSSAGVPQVSSNSITVCWLPALDGGGLDDLHYNIYLYVTSNSNPIFNKVNNEPVEQSLGGGNQTTICYTLQDIDTQTSYGIIVVSANGATGDPAVLRNADEVQDFSVVFFLSLGDDLVPRETTGEPSCNGTQLLTNHTQQLRFVFCSLVLCLMVGLLEVVQLF